MTGVELLYEIHHSDGNQLKRISPERRATCAVSLKNLIAFTSHADLTKKTRLTNSLAENLGTLGTHVYVADLNTPWDCYLVTNSNVEISNLCWSSKGHLLVATENGQVEVYEMVDHLLNKWHLLYEAAFPGEPILTSCWLQFPKKVCINPDKMDSMLYSEKYDIRQIPSKNGFGGKSLDGCLVVTATGLLGCIVHASDDSSKVISSVEKMIAVRHRIMCADMAYSRDGNIVIVSCGNKVVQPVQLNRVSVRLFGCRDKAEIIVTASQSLFLPSPKPSLPDHDILSVKFGNKTNPDVLLVSLINRDTCCSVLCLYELVKQPVTLKARFHTSNELIPTYRWQQSAQVQFNSGIEELCTVALPITTTLPNSSSVTQNHNQSVNAAIQPLVAVSLSNGAIHLVRYDSLVQVGMVPGGNYALKRERDSEPESKQLKLGMDQVPSVSMQFTWSGSLLVALNANSAFSVYRVHSNIDASTATSLIELSMMGGSDPWDISMCLRQNQIENIVDRLSETFARQPPPVQCYYNVKILVIKAALYRLVSGGQARANDQQTLLILNLVSGALKALLRPSGLSSHDKGPAEALSGLLSSKGESLSDVDQVLFHLEAKEYTVEPSTLQSLQPIMQWCADLALKLLATLPDLRHSRAPGWEVCRDSKAVGALRELIVLMRIWGLIRKSCLPSFRRTSESADVLPLLFRLLTRLSVAPDPDETLIDDCCLLPSEVQIPTYNAYSPIKNHGLAFSSIFSRNLPMHCEFGSNPVKWHSSLDESNGVWMDGLRLLWLGKNPAGVKVCNRCGCSTLIHMPPRSAANKAWDNRWLCNCPCGGHWKIPSYLPQPKVVEPDVFLNF